MSLEAQIETLNTNIAALIAVLSNGNPPPAAAAEANATPAAPRASRNKPRTQEAAVNAAPASPAETVSSPEPAPSPAPAAPAPAPTPATTPPAAAPAKALTIQEVNKAALALVQANGGSQAKLAEVLKKYGAARTSNVPPNQYAAFVADCTALMPAKAA